jgi:hypothetical protein
LTYTNDIADIASLLAGHIEAVSSASSALERHGSERAGDGLDECQAEVIVLPLGADSRDNDLACIHN